MSKFVFGVEIINVIIYLCGEVCNKFAHCYLDCVEYQVSASIPVMGKYFE